MNSKTGRCEVTVTPERKCIEEVADEDNNHLNWRCCCLNSCLLSTLILGDFFFVGVGWGFC